MKMSLNSRKSVPLYTLSYLTKVDKIYADKDTNPQNGWMRDI